jgi:uncharacterized membrane protein (UPF0127 family)
VTGVAERRRERMRGLIGGRALCALLLPRTRSVHTFGMREPIDVVLLDEDLRIVEIVHLPPHRVLLPRARVRHVLEVPRSPFRTGDLVRIAGERSVGEEAEEFELQDGEQREGRDGGGNDPSGPSGKGDRRSATGRSDEAEQFEELPHTLPSG